MSVCMSVRQHELSDFVDHIIQSFDNAPYFLIIDKNRAFNFFNVAQIQ